MNVNPQLPVIDGPLAGQLMSIPEGHGLGDRVMLREPREFKINPFHEDIHDVMFPQSPINPISETVHIYKISERGLIHCLKAG